MKKCVAVVSLAIICLSFTFNFAQSRRVPPYSESGNEKSNKHPPQTEVTPTPQPKNSEEDPNTTNIERIDTSAAESTDDVIKIDTKLNKSPFPFPIPTSGTPGNKGTTAEDYRLADEYLDEMANRTGGRLYQASTTANLTTAFSNIANELRQFYSLGYYPKEESETGKRRKIKVRVNKTGLVVRAPGGYVVGKKEEKK
ncbi:MAG: hypothetical protein ACR2MG_02700 [Pyrinomonadaceae bacterium]